MAHHLTMFHYRRWRIFSEATKLQVAYKTFHEIVNNSRYVAGGQWSSVSWREYLKIEIEDLFQIEYIPQEHSKPSFSFDFNLTVYSISLKYKIFLRLLYVVCCVSHYLLNSLKVTKRSPSAPLHLLLRQLSSLPPASCTTNHHQLLHSPSQSS